MSSGSFATNAASVAASALKFGGNWNSTGPSLRVARSGSIALKNNS